MHVDDLPADLRAVITEGNFCICHPRGSRWRARLSVRFVEREAGVWTVSASTPARPLISREKRALSQCLRRERAVTKRHFCERAARADLPACHDRDHDATTKPTLISTSQPARLTRHTTIPACACGSSSPGSSADLIVIRRRAGGLAEGAALRAQATDAIIIIRRRGRPPAQLRRLAGREGRHWYRADQGQPRSSTTPPAPAHRR